MWTKRGREQRREWVKTILIDFPKEKRLNSPIIKQTQHSGKMQSPTILRSIDTWYRHKKYFIITIR